jgi:hypothetical protein
MYSSILSDSSSLDNPEQDSDDGNHQQNVDDIAYCESKETDDPKNDEYDCEDI